jgi:thiol-disulfide isomerase/thioredoxin/Tfp pilus assembly protein PilF
MRKPMRALCAAISVLALTLSGIAEAKPGRAKAAASGDRVVVSAMQVRDRGELRVAIDTLRDHLARNPRDVAAHRLYQEIAAVSRRDGALVAAEYRANLDAAPSDPLAMVLYAGAVLTAAVTTRGYLSGELVKDIERNLAASEGDKAMAGWSHLVAAEVAAIRNLETEVLTHLELARDADATNPSVRTELVKYYVKHDRIAEAAEVCFDLLDDTPWRALACAPLVPSERRAAAAAAPVLEKLSARLLAIEKKSATDPVVLQSMVSFYEAAADREGQRRVEAVLRAAAPGLAAPLRRNPYLAPLPDGELSDEEQAGLDEIRKAVESAAADDDASPDARRVLDALLAIEPSLPPSPRVRSVYWSVRGRALRAEEVGDRDGSRAAMRTALDLMPDDPEVLNEWAYLCALDRVDLAHALEASEKSLALLLGAPFDLREIEPRQTFADYADARADSAGAYLDTRGWILHQLGRSEEAVRDLVLAASLTDDGTVEAHLGRARYALGQDDAAFQHLLRGLARGCEELDEVKKLAEHLYDRGHVVRGGLEALVAETARTLRREGADIDDEDDDDDDDDDDEDEDGDEDEDEDDGAHVDTRLGDHALVGRTAPALSLTKLDGRVVDLAALSGSIVVVDFWATWCRPCVDALPAYDAIGKAFDGQGVVLLLVSLDDSMETLRRFWGTRAIAAELGLGGAGTGDTWDVDALPTTFVVDRGGTVIYSHQGYEPAFRQELSRLLADLVTE